MRGSEYLESPLKRRLDIAIATGALPITSPLWGIMYAYNKHRQQPFLFKQERIGKNGTSFFMWKFETLYTGAENEAQHMKQLTSNSLDREKTDTRIPNSFLRFLRQTGLNELPQLINVTNGDMSIVGPRPLPPEFIDGAREIFPNLVQEWCETTLIHRPGFLGVSPRNTRKLPIQQFNDIAVEDIKYCQQATLWKDLTIIAEAFSGMFSSN